MYLFLVTVSDADGLSWYSGAALCRVLSWTPPQLRHVRDELREADLVAYRKPLYQVLDLSPIPVMFKCAETVRTGEAVAIGEIMKGLAGGGAR